MNTIKITSLNVIHADEQRGSTLEVNNRRSGDFILCYRKEGTSSGRHYHTGKSPHKDPEILYLLSGKVEFRWYPMADGAAAMRKQEITAPAKLEIPAMIWHELWALTDCSFWEMNSIEDVKGDSIRVEQ